MMDSADQDVTVLRLDRSVSKSASGEGAGEADPPRVLKQRFVLEDKLGSGGMGTVYKAKDLRKVEARDRQPFLAVKVLNNDFREHPEAFIALQREAAKSQVLSHPSVVSIYDFDKDGDVPFIIMELLEGQELADLIRAYPNGLPDDMAWKVIAGMCGGLQHAHEAGIVHADFKPGNVFVSPQSTAKILDFGIARAVQLNQLYDEDTAFDPSRLAALTPAYASREMLNGDNPEVRDDIYSLGIVLYLVLTGHHPFGRTSAVDAAKQGLRPERPKRLSRRQWGILERCLRFDRADRPASVAMVAEHLLEPSPWPSRAVSALVATLLIVLGANYFIGGAELTEVKQEVRQSTLIDAQVAQVAGLLATPTFEPGWEQQLLQGLKDLGNLNPPGDLTNGLANQVIEVYTEHIEAAGDIDTAAELLAHAQDLFGPMDKAAAFTHERMVRRVLDLLDQPVAHLDWVSQVDSELLRLAEHFPRSRALALLQLEFSDLLEVQVLESIEHDRFPLAERALEELAPVLFDAEALERLTRLVADAELRYAVAQQRQASKNTARAFNAELSQALEASCLRLDVPRLAQIVARWTAKDAALEDGVRERIGARIAHCVAQLNELDVIRAQVLQNQAEAALGDLPGRKSAALDPCRVDHLVGNGGRAGGCADAQEGGENGARLVVIPRQAAGVQRGLGPVLRAVS